MCPWLSGEHVHFSTQTQPELQRCCHHGLWNSGSSGCHSCNYQGSPHRQDVKDDKRVTNPLILTIYPQNKKQKFRHNPQHVFPCMVPSEITPKALIRTVSMVQKSAIPDLWGLWRAPEGHSTCKVTHLPGVGFPRVLGHSRNTRQG